MSCRDSPCMTPATVENQCEAGDRGGEARCLSGTGTGADSSARERAIKEVGLTSAMFIGPTLPPGKSAPRSSKIEDTLSQFYKELKEIDTPAAENSGQHATAPERSASKQTQGKKRHSLSNSVETDGNWKSSGERPPPWTHWYHNEPYRPRRLRPGTDMPSAGMVPPQSQWHYPHSQDRPPQPRSHRPPFHHPPPPSAFPHPQYRPPPQPRMNPNWSYSGTASQYQEESAFSHMPSPNVCAPPTQGEYEEYSYYSDGDKQGHAYDGYSHNGDRDELCSPFVDDYHSRQRFVSQNETWEQQHHHLPPDITNAYHSPLMLMLMRGLPGSGKSTLARELLSTGPSGLIISTDDYFDHKKGYRYEPALLGVAHKWSQTRARDAMHNHRSPIIVDNTNIQAWEMKPYVIMALERGYEVAFCEPATSWKMDPSELEKKNKHGVSKEKIAQMLDRFTFPISIDIVLNSQEPQHVQPQRPVQPPQIIWAHRVLY